MAAAMTSNLNVTISDPYPCPSPYPPGAYIFETIKPLSEEPLPLITDTDIATDSVSSSNADSDCVVALPSGNAEIDIVINACPNSPSSYTTALPPTQSVPSYSVASSTYRVSRLPPAPTVPQAGPSRTPQRYLFFAVRRGYRAGVYTHWHEAERQIIDFPHPVFKTFSTRLAAEAFVAGWHGAGRHSLPTSSPFPLREHLAMSFPGSVPMPSSPGRRQSYHARMLTTSPPPASDDFSSSPVDTTRRPPLDPRKSVYRHSMVRISSPLRQEVDEEEPEVSGFGTGKSRKPPLKKAVSLIGIGGLLSPPQSPEKGTKRLSMMERERPTKPRSPTDSGLWASSNHRDFNPSQGHTNSSLGLLNRPLSPPLSAEDNRRATIHGSMPKPIRTPSGLWADPASKQQQSSPLSAPRSESPEFADPTAPKFSRSALKKSGVVMPVAAKRQNSSNSLRSIGSLSSLRSPSANSSSTSVQSWSNGRRSSSISSAGAQDRLSSLAETSKRELQLNDSGLLALGSLSPPRPAFMMRRSSSSSSVASNDSVSSMGSLTSASSAQTSTMDSCEPIMEEESRANLDMEVEIVGETERDIISCTKSDGDAEGSVGDRDSLRNGKTGKKGKGGMFKRLAKALKLEKKVAPGQDSFRRGSM